MRWLCLCALVVGCGPPSVSQMWPTAQPLPFVHQARFAITDNLSDELSFVDASSPTLLGNIPVGDVPVELEGPHHLTASPDGKFIYYNLSNYVPGTGSGPHGAHGTGMVPGSLVKLDATTGEELAEVLVDRSPGDVILSRDGKWAFVSHYDLARYMAAVNSMVGLPESAYSAIAIVDTTSMTRVSLTPVCPTAHGEGLSADDNTLYVTCAFSDEVAVLDVTDRAHPTVTTKVKVGPVAGTLDSPSYSPYALSVSPADGSVWISNNRSGDVRVFDPTTMAMDPNRIVNLNGVAMFGSFSPDGKTYYVPHQQAMDILHAIDTTTLAQKQLPLPPMACLNAHAFVLGPDGATGVIVCEGDHMTRPGQVDFINVAGGALTLIAPVTVGMFADGATWLPAQ